MNNNTLEEVQQLIERFLNLAIAPNELSTFMNKLFKTFEKSLTQFKNLNDKEKFSNGLQKIKEPINEFQKNSENTLNLWKPVEEIEKSNKLEKMNDILKHNKNMIESLKQKSKNISEKIKKLEKNMENPRSQ